MQVLSIFWINFDDNRLVQKLIEMAVGPYSMRGQKKLLYLTLLFWGTGKNSLFATSVIASALKALSCPSWISKYGTIVQQVSSENIHLSCGPHG